METQNGLTVMTLTDLKQLRLKAFLGIIAALAVLLAALVLTQLGLREELRELLVQREGRVIVGLFEGRMSALKAEGNEDPLFAAVDLAAMPQLSGLRSVALYDAEGRFPTRLIGAELTLAPSVSVEQILAERVRVEYVVRAEDQPAVLRVFAALRDEVGQGVSSILALETEAEDLRAEFGRMDETLKGRAGWILLVSGGALLAVLSAAFYSLAQANRRLVNQRIRLEKANRELTLAARTGAVGAVASHLVHGLRSPLTGLQQFIRGISREGNSAEEAREAEAALRRMKAMIDEVVGILRDEGGVSDFEISVAELLPMVARRMPEHRAIRGVTVVVRSQSQRVLTNKVGNLLLLIVENLLTNAAEASPDGSTVEVTAIEGEGGRLEIRVKDQGEGLSETSLNTVFEPVISTKPGGSGLGLAITRRLALSIEGELIVQSTGLKGTVFLLTL